eukprot:365026-Chlamydomonas_euryale.AAC.3
MAMLGGGPRQDCRSAPMLCAASRRGGGPHQRTSTTDAFLWGCVPCECMHCRGTAWSCACMSILLHGRMGAPSGPLDNMQPPASQGVCGRLDAHACAFNYGRAWRLDVYACAFNYGRAWRLNVYACAFT